MYNNEPIKLCAKCKRSLPFSEFYNNKKSLDGKSSYCKECSRISSRKSKEKKELEKYKLKQLQKEQNILHQKQIEKEALNKKICFRCKIEKPIDEFHRDAKAKDGRSSICIDCKRKREAENIVKRLEKRGY